jgi:hypothetical protein
MKIIIRALIILSICSTIGYAQLDISYGVKGGLNRSSSNNQNADWITQYAVGGFVEFRFRTVSIQPEIFYSVKGDKYNDDVNSYSINTPPYDPVYYTVAHTNTYSYLDIPILVKFHLQIPDMKSFLFIGPSLGFLLSANHHQEELGIATDIENKNAFEKTSYGFVGGIGSDIPFYSFEITLDARYGLSTLIGIDGHGSFNEVFSIYVGIRL